MPRPSPMLCGSEWPKRVSALFLDDGELMRTDHCSVDSIREGECGIDADAGMFRRDVLLDEVFEHHLWDFDPVERDGIDVHVALPGAAFSVSCGLHFVAATENRHEGVARIAAMGDLVEIDQSSSAHDPGFPMHLEVLHTLGKLRASRGEPGVDFAFGEDSRSFVGPGSGTIFADVVELALSATNCRVIVAWAGEEGTVCRARAQIARSSVQVRTRRIYRPFC